MDHHHPSQTYLATHHLKKIYHSLWKKIQNLINVACFNKAVAPLKDDPKINKRTPMFILDSRVDHSL